MWDSQVICLNNVLHMLARRSANVDKLSLSQATSYETLPTIIWRARRWIFSSDFDCSFVRLVCQAWHAYSKIGWTTAWKKCSRSSLETPANFSFFKAHITSYTLATMNLKGYQNVTWQHYRTWTLTVWCMSSNWRLWSCQHIIITYCWQHVLLTQRIIHNVSTNSSQHTSITQYKPLSSGHRIYMYTRQKQFMTMTLPVTLVILW